MEAADGEGAAGEQRGAASSLSTSVEQAVREIWRETPGIGHRELLARVVQQRRRVIAAAPDGTARGEEEDGGPPLRRRVREARRALPYRRGACAAAECPSEEARVELIGEKLLERQRLRGLRRFGEADRIFAALEGLGIQMDEKNKTWSLSSEGSLQQINLEKIEAIGGGRLAEPSTKTNEIAGNDAQSSVDLTHRQCAVCGQAFASRNQLFKHIRDSACGTDPTRRETVPPAPSALRRERRRALHREQRQRRRDNRTGRTARHARHCLWLGDLPLPWTRHGGDHRRLRALLRAHLPRSAVAPPWIKLVQRKAYRAQQGNDDDETGRAYLGYAIVVFRDEQECETVLQLDGREVSVDSVESELTKDDFASLVQNVAPFCLKVRPVENKETPQSTVSSTLNMMAGKDPPLSDQLRPLPTKTLLARAAAVQQRSGVSIITNNGDTTKSEETNSVSSDIEEHQRALQKAVGVYLSTPARPEIRHEGRPIPDEIRDRLLSILQNLRWAVPNHRSGLTSERYLVLQSNVANDPFYADLREACRSLMDWADPRYYYSGIAATKNFVSSPHVDDRDRTSQYAVSLGDFTTGGELCVDGEDGEGNEVIHVVSTRNRIARVDGRHVHWVRTWEGGDRFSLIFYDTSDRNPTSILKMGVNI